MKLFISEFDEVLVKDKWVFVDTNFLSLLFSQQEIFEETLSLFKGATLTIDPFVKFEFLRDVFDDKYQETKRKFIEDTSIFCPATDDPHTYESMRDSALELSRIYASQGRAKGVSLVDLLLAGRVNVHVNSLLVTANKKDFPSFLFDTNSILNYEQNDGIVISAPILNFNQKNFKKMKTKLGL